ncbi:hypothetical protein K488DRAFT_56816 [Vararia minispora EC-137]|uniref:Uncharacterized protein n=1 Tax=Vararia minispora EC-137 TaxID=1314806 RepID=A0ACB8QBY3_9AGAM|nr:hypothetical protein K488DRAFT_56816 [Vararia minispora EC-137]
MAQKQTFVAWCPDYTDPDALSRRLAVRTAHLEGIKQTVADGSLKFGGYTTAPESVGKPPGEHKINGSTMIFEAESVEEVRRRIEEDPYWAGNVWDKEKVDIRPIFASSATPLK